MIIIKNFKLLSIYFIFLVIFTVYVILDTFVLSTSYDTIISNNNKDIDTGVITSDKMSYKDDNIKIKISEYIENDTKIYVADVEVNDSSYLKTAFAKDTYGKNITDKTSSISESVNAILSINGDFYGVQIKGFVLKNGKIYRSISNSNEDLVIYSDGNWDIINENNTDIDSLLNNGAYNLLSFGPALIKNYNISVSVNDEVDKARTDNPRTAIGKISNNHYLFVVSDGRTTESKGLTLYQLATFMKKLDCEVAYNLDGGGSSTMYFNGEIINNPTSGHGGIKERSVSDIVYIGY